MARLKHIAQQRLDKLEKIRGLGLNPYPRTYHRSHNVQEALTLFQQLESEPGKSQQEFRLAGRVTAIRFIGKIAFFDIRDGSGKIQVFLSHDILGNEKYELLHEIDIGDIIGATGKIFRTRAGEISIEAKDFTILAKSLQPLPEKWHGLVDVEKRYRQRYLDLISNEEIKVLFLNRSRVISAVRLFLDERGFIEVETPVLQPVAGGALARRFKTHHQALDQDLYLRIALELYLKRLIIGGIDKVYEVGRVFRNEGISTRHNPEFTMAEIYEAYADYDDMMAMFEDMVCYIAKKVTGKTSIKFGEEVVKLEPPWRRIKLRDAIKEGCGIDFEDYPDVDSLGEKMKQLGQDVDPKKDRGRLIDELISTYVEPHLIQPTFLVDYPLDMSPLAKRKDESRTIVERFEAFIGGMEVANAFTELNDPIEQRDRFLKQKHIRSADSIKSRAGEEREVDVIDEDFLLAMEYGMPPTGGLGVGIDRLAMLFTDKQSIREVIFFPQLKTK
ncbi:MAG TPA: lysine--tRNA ligase [Dehalococcoidia bacterium]